MKNRRKPILTAENCKSFYRLKTRGERRHSEFAAMVNGGKSFGGITVSLLNRLDGRAKILEELQLAAEILRQRKRGFRFSRRFRGYGMLLAEIGTPPGADVDRASLEKAVQESWSFSRYEILPDKIIVYLWANPGGTRFDFKFKQRYGINAQTAPSVIYDYYNEEARATIAPIKFSVR